ncbi:16S rRNA (cytosine967-C5)-methyltransferase [Candidatus Nanopelagicus hibericus]|uniref:16S rRNA (Cytosine967-C5)-methyltransferase n=1 Tax=Candidatus Nanopelagicus hibericus TaxID=1884915 RepID=A0A249K999_9ACTN|nr:transcription antitermination factor NusB [Candidatus Nanopelagicus hibericus]ASY13316.1 16S rRNA (cytosine967-C5)-methyltransferase [Candidatus Nanopelagicus hibericus]
MAKPNPAPSRLVAYELITQVNRQGAYANLRLPELLLKTKMNLADRAFTTELAYGTLRMQARHDYIASKFIDRTFAELDEKIVDLLRMGIHQITQMRVADHAAVSETVEVAKLVAGESKASYVNAILRKVSANSNDLLEIKDFTTLRRLSIQYSHPEWIISSFFDQMKDWAEVELFLAANNNPATPDVVAWPGKSSTDELLTLGATPIPGFVNGVNLPGIPMDFSPIVERRAGVQDRGSQLVVENFLASFKPGLSWLDMCAGPGGKAAYLFNSLLSMDKSATFLANEPTSHRAELVKRVVNNQQVVSFDATVANNFNQKFDRILIDAPCTGLGALRRRPEARWRKSLQDLKELVLLQKQLLASAYQLLSPNGVIAYVTCSPHLAETKGQVIDFLSAHSDMKMLPMGKLELAHKEGVLSDGTVQLWTHHNQSDAMFMAMFEKVG